MSNSYKLDENTHLHVNSDLSGCVIFRAELPLVQIDKETLLEIVSDYVRMQKIRELELLLKLPGVVYDLVIEKVNLVTSSRD